MSYIKAKRVTERERERERARRAEQSKAEQRRAMMTKLNWIFKVPNIRFDTQDQCGKFCLSVWSPSNSGHTCSTWTYFSLLKWRWPLECIFCTLVFDPKAQLTLNCSIMYIINVIIMYYNVLVATYSQNTTTPKSPEIQESISAFCLHAGCSLYIVSFSPKITFNWWRWIKVLGWNSSVSFKGLRTITPYKLLIYYNTSWGTGHCTGTEKDNDAFLISLLAIRFPPPLFPLPFLGFISLRHFPRLQSKFLLIFLFNFQSKFQLNFLQTFSLYW